MHSLSQKASPQVEEALRQSEQRFSAAFQAGPPAITLTSAQDDCCIEVNKTFERLTGWTRDEVIGRTPYEIGIWVYSGQRTTIVKRLLRGEVVRNVEIRFRMKNGEIRKGIASADMFELSGKGKIVCTAMDMIARPMAEQASSSLSQRLIEAHEEERAALARELHDDINQRIALLAAKLDRLNQDPPESAIQGKQLIGEVSKQLTDLAGDIQALSHRLHSPALGLLGLAAAAANFCKEFASLQEVKIDFYTENMPEDVSPQISLCLFRILQQALQNAVKHSGSRHFRVSLTGRAGEIELTVHDSGIGFDFVRAIRGRGLGLISMQERLKLVGGQLFIESMAQQGTTLQARVPLSPMIRSSGAAG